MTITQLSIKMINRPGELSKVSDIMGDQGINIRAITASVHGEDAQIHLVPDDADKSLEVLKSRGYEVVVRQVLAVETPDHPGGLNAILRPLKEAGINVEFLYPFIGKHEQSAIMIVGGEPISEAVQALEKYYITILGDELDAF